jgi:hypothetical protein
LIYSITQTWYPAEITKIFKTVASVKYDDDGKIEDEIPLDIENLKRYLLRSEPMH